MKKSTKLLITGIVYGLSASFITSFFTHTNFFIGISIMAFSMFSGGFIVSSIWVDILEKEFNS